jgi:putative hemolysin
VDQQTLFNAVLVLVFVVVGGVFSGTEIALVSLRESQIDQLEKQSRRGARVAEVARDPNRFLAAVQIGVTVAGFFSAAYGASTLAPDFVPLLIGVGLSEGVAETVAVLVLTLVVAYLSLVLGELVPKRLALQRSAALALLVGPPLDRFARLMRPVIWLLSRSTDAVVRLLRGDPKATSEEVSDEELRYLVDQNTQLDDDEKAILRDVFDAGDRSIAQVMRPRGDVAALPHRSRVADVMDTIRQNPYSRYPVVGVGLDDVRGFLHVRDLLGVDPDTRLSTLTRPVLFLPATNRVLSTLAMMRAEGAHLAVVVDEYGGTDGIVTLEDLVEELVGEIRDEYDHELPVERAGDIDAGLSVEEFSARAGLELEPGPYETAAGYVLHRLGRLAEVGDRVAVGAHDLVVTAVDRLRITRLAVRPGERDEEPTGEEPELS